MVSCNWGSQFDRSRRQRPSDLTCSKLGKLLKVRREVCLAKSLGEEATEMDVYMEAGQESVPWYRLMYIINAFQWPGLQGTLAFSYHLVLHPLTKPFSAPPSHPPRTLGAYFSYPPLSNP